MTNSTYTIRIAIPVSHIVANHKFTVHVLAVRAESLEEALGKISEGRFHDPDPTLVMADDPCLLSVVPSASSTRPGPIVVVEHLGGEREFDWCEASMGRDSDEAIWCLCRLAKPRPAPLSGAMMWDVVARFDSTRAALDNATVYARCGHIMRVINARTGRDQHIVYDKTLDKCTQIVDGRLVVDPPWRHKLEDGQ